MSSRSQVGLVVCLVSFDPTSAPLYYSAASKEHSHRRPKAPEKLIFPETAYIALIQGFAFKSESRGQTYELNKYVRKRINV